MHKGFLFGTALVLTSGLAGRVFAQTTPPTTTPAPASGQGEMVVQLQGTLSDPTACANQLLGQKIAGTNLGYGTKEWTNLNYPIALGDYLEYEVLIPSTSTLHGGAVDGDVTGSTSHGGTIRDSYATEDQNGLFAHSATDYDVLSFRTVPQVVNGQITNVPMWGTDQWYKRDIDLSKVSIPSKAGTPAMLTDLFVVVDEHDTTHQNDLCPVNMTNANYTAVFRNINIKNHDMTGKEVVKLAIYNGEAMLPGNMTTISLTGGGFTNGSVSVVPYTGPNTIAPASLTPFVPATATEAGAAMPVSNPTQPQTNPAQPGTNPQQTGTGTSSTGTGTNPASP